MPRRDFLQDLKYVLTPGKYPYLINIRAGPDDGVLCFTYLKDGTGIDLEAFVTGKQTIP